MAKQLTETEIAMRIVPTMVRWPAPEVAKTVAWDKLREAGGSLRGLATAVDAGCREAEQNANLSSDGIARRRHAIGRQALSELKNFKPFQSAESWTLDNIKLLEEKMTGLPQPPTAIADVMLAQEIREYIRRQKSRIDVAMRGISDPVMLRAILTAPACLSGLSDVELNVVRERARTTLHPEQAQMQQSLTKALDEVREGVAATKRMLLERCEMRDDRDNDAQATREASSGVALPGKTGKSEAAGPCTHNNGVRLLAAAWPVFGQWVTL